MMRRLPAFMLLAAMALAFVPGVLPPAVIAGSEEGEAGDSGEADAPDTAQVDTTSVIVPPDTAVVGAARRSGRRVAPSYQTKYDINRNTNSWSQTLSFGTWAGGLDLSNTTTVTIGKDQTLDRDRRNNTNNLNLAYQFPSGLKLTGVVGITRNQTVDAGRTDTRQDSENVTAGAQYSRELGGGVSGTFSVGAGSTHDVRVDPLTSSRESFGPHADASAKFTTKRLADWGLNTSIRSARLQSTESRTNTRTDDHNLTGDISLTSSFRVPGFDPWQLRLGNRLNRTQYPFLSADTSGAQIVRQETNDNLSRDMNLSTSMSPRPRLRLTGSASYRNNDVNRAVDTQRSQQSIDKGLKGTLGYQFSDSTRVDLRGEWSRARSLFDDPSREFLTGDTVNRILGGNVRRPLGPRAAFDLAGSYSVQSFFFDDPERNTDDRDIVHGDAVARLDYYPMKKITTGVRFSVQHNQTIFIDESKSGTNQTQQVWSITPTFEYKISPRVTFREEGSAIANVTYFDFNENNNRLSRTTELRSTIDARVTSRLALNLRHSLRLLQDGSYRRGEDGIRRFGQSREDNAHDLTFRADYTALQGLKFGFRNNKRVSDVSTFQVRGGQLVAIRAGSEFNEIEFSCQVSRTLRLGPTVGANLRRYQSWTDRDVHNNYWVGNMSFGYVF